MLLMAPLVAPMAPELHAQTLATSDPVLEQIWEEAMEQSQLERLGQTLMDSIGPRLTGSPGIDRAHDWVVRQYQAWGIQAENRQYGTWTGWRRGTSQIDLLEPRVRSLEGMNLAWSPGTAGPVQGSVVALPNTTDAGAFQTWLPSVRGKFVLASFPEPTCRPDRYWEEYGTPETVERMRADRTAAREAWQARSAAGGENARALQLALEEAGALGLVTLNWGGGAWGAVRVFNAFTREIPTFQLSCEDYGLVHRLAENNQGPVLRVDFDAEFLGDVPVFNTVATIPGTELPDEYVMLSAHFDSWDGSSGANDNGSGTVLMMEVMRILNTVYPNPRRTILVGHWGGEEQGLNGSRAFAEDHPEVVSGLQALFNQDNGTGRVVNISASGFVDAGGHLARWLARVPAEVTTHIRLNAPGTPATGGSDHAAFVCHGAAAFSLGSHPWDYFSYTWHSNRDTFDKMVFDDIRNNAVLAASLVYLASEDPERVSTEQRTVFPVSPFSGQMGSWPECATPDREAATSPRM